MGLAYLFNCAAILAPQARAVKVRRWRVAVVAMPPTITPHAFVAKWRGDTRKERSASQYHFFDLCRLLALNLERAARQAK